MSTELRLPETEEIIVKAQVSFALVVTFLFSFGAHAVNYDDPKIKEFKPGMSSAERAITAIGAEKLPCKNHAPMGEKKVRQERTAQAGSHQVR